MSNLAGKRATLGQNGGEEEGVLADETGAAPEEGLESSSLPQEKLPVFGLLWP